jgi:FixJ family two-component response regulator
VVDGDVNIQQSLELLILSQGWQPQICAVGEFLGRSRSPVPSCLILAFSSLDSTGLEVQKRIARECSETPIIVAADYGDIPTTVQAMKAGAVDFLVKPFSQELLLAAIRPGLSRSRATSELLRFAHSTGTTSDGFSGLWIIEQACRYRTGH